jgi:hypothetical protein
MPKISEAVIAALVTGLVTLALGMASYINSTNTARNIAERDLFAIRTLISAATSKEIGEVSVIDIRRALMSGEVTTNEFKQLIRTNPGFIWLKRRVVTEDETYYVMVQTSTYYARHLLNRPASFYTGKRDEEVYDAATAARFFAADEQAYNSGVALSLEYELTSKMTGLRYHFTGIKWHFSSDGEDYVAGMGQIKEIKT